MPLHNLRQVGHSICNSGIYTIMADECTDVSNVEQFTISIGWVRENLINYEDVISLRHIEIIDANCLTEATKDVLQLMNLKLSDCSGQWYNGAPNTTGSKHVVPSCNKLNHMLC